MNSRLFALMVVMSSISYCFGQLSIDKHFSDHMVLQQNQPIPLSGTALPNTGITVTFKNKDYYTQASNQGDWTVTLDAQKPNKTGQELKVSSTAESIKLQDVLVGDVWLCIGQSNMEFTLRQEKHYESEKNYLDRPLLRFYNPTFAGKHIYNSHFKDSVLDLLTPEHFYSAVDWEVSSEESAPSISAVGYYFGNMLIDSVDVPIGLVNLAIGGAPVETFINTETLAENPRFSAKTKGNWLENDALPVWIRERGKQNVGKKALYADQQGPNHAYKPGFAYSGGIASLANFPIRGILWYQGESNAQEMERVLEYNELQKLMLNSYRKLWKNPKLPFYFAQLSSIDTLKYKGQLWPEFRNQQRLFLMHTKNTGMVVTSDIGAKDDVHPKDKKTVGKRMARWVLKDLYHQNMLASGPLVTKADYRHGKVIIYFDSIGGGLSFLGDALNGFYLDGKSVSATIQGNKVIIPAKQKPKRIAYGLASYSNGNLINSEGLPASTFILTLR